MLFKVIAVRPLDKCAPYLIKNLLPNQLYQLYNDYTFVLDKSSPQHDINNIEYKDVVPVSFYSPMNDDQELEINISAIVGKNGCGKSCIAELVFASIFNFACVNKLAPLVDDTGDKVEIEKGLFTETYYHIGSYIYKLRCSGKLVHLFRYSLLDHDGFVNVTLDEKINATVKEVFFYTVGMNYSLFGLNVKNSGNWLQHVFHKNDGYRTPIVLNPFRDKGEININREESLTKNRLLSNILSIKENKQTAGSNAQVFSMVYSELAPGRIVDNVLFQINPSKSLLKDELLQQALNVKKEAILKPIFEAFNIDLTLLDKSSLDYQVAFGYIVKKVYLISQKYERYQDKECQFLKKIVFTHGDGATRYILIKTHLDNFVTKLKEDSSHITFKLTQALNYLENREFYQNYIGKPIPVEQLAVAIHLNIKKQKKLIDIIPPPFFDMEIEFKNGSNLKTLSSGEKQKIFSSTSYLYHLINIDSIVEGNEYLQYKYINIVFDEIELYYHPDFQRTIVHDFIENIKRISVPSIKGINCVFITHSPFILSDIPNNNILYLKEYLHSDGKNYSFPSNNEVKTNSFGANIHELLTHSFFMTNTIGEFALGKIGDIISFSNSVINANRTPKGLEIMRDQYLKNEKTYKFIYENIGEDYLKSILGNQIEALEEVLGIDEFINIKIEAHLQEIVKLKQLQKNAKNKIRN